MTDKSKSRQERMKKQKTSPKTTKTNSKKRPVGKIILFSLLGLFVLSVVTGIIAFFILISDAPKLDETLLKDPVPSKFYDKDGNIVEELGIQNRETLTYDEIPKVLEDAVLSIEDRNFYNHRGIDIKRTLAAVLGVFTSGSLEGQGGSTITQQIVKLSFLTPEKTVKRKVQEWYLSYQLEKIKSKQEILEIYLNKIYYDNGIYGVKKAAQIYFGKELKDLTTSEAATLAGIPQRPSAYDPFNNPDAAEQRRNTVLNAMEANGKITAAEKQQAMEPAVKDLVVEENKNLDFNETKYQSFFNQVQKEIAELSDNRINIYTDGLEIHTTLNTTAQEVVEDILNTDKYISYPSDQFQAGVVLMDTKTGEIRAIGGGRNNDTARGYNFATDIKRQPGSTIKPILDYGPAIEYLKWGTGKRMKDEPVTYSSGQSIGNADNKYKGELTMRDAIAYSRNTTAYKTFLEVGAENAKEFSQGLGFNLKHMYESYSIGGFDATDGTNPMQMAGAFAAFGNNGIYNKPHTVVKIVFPDGQVVKNSQYLPKPQQVMKDYTAFMITDMLRSVVDYGTGTRANISGYDVAGKSGSTNFDDETRKKYNIPSGASKDVWFTGYTPELTASVWTGYEKNGVGNYISSVNYSISQRIFKELMSKTVTDKSQFKKPSSVSQANGEYYVKGTQPDTPIIKVQKPTDLSAAYNKDTNSIDLSWNYPGDGEVVFEVNYTVNGQNATLLSSTTSKTATLPNVVAGSIYSFTITAVYENEKGEPANVSVTVPIAEVIPPPSDDDTDDGDGNNDNNDNNGDGNNNNGGTPSIPGTTPPGNNEDEEDDTTTPPSTNGSP